jgi:hypothetical protein
LKVVYSPGAGVALNLKSIPGYIIDLKTMTGAILRKTKTRANTSSEISKKDNKKRGTKRTKTWTQKLHVGGLRLPKVLKNKI